MKQYTVTGMSCAACSTRVEKAVSKVPGVTSCSVSLLNQLHGRGRKCHRPGDHKNAVADAGYGASAKRMPKEKKTGGAKQRCSF